MLGLQVASLALDVPGAVRRALHPITPVAPTTYCGGVTGDRWRGRGGAEGWEENERKKGIRELVQGFGFNLRQ